MIPTVKRLSDSGVRRWPSLGAPVPPVRSGPGERSFGLSVGGVFLAVAGFSAWRGYMVRAEVVGAVGTLLMAAAVVRPRSLARLSRGWARLGGAIGWFNSRVLLTVMFALIFTPFGIVARAIGKDPLGRRRSTGSGWSTYPDRFLDSKHYERLF
jgi:hypothetical protein